MKVALLLAVIFIFVSCVNEMLDKPVIQSVSAASFIYDDKAAPITADEYVYDTQKPALHASQFLYNPAK